MLDRCWILGNSETKDLLSEESKLVEQYYRSNDPIPTVSIFKRLEPRGEVFFSRSYARVKVRNSFTILYNDHNYGEIEYFIQYRGKAAAMVRKFRLLSTPASFKPCSLLAVGEGDLEVIALDCISEKCMFINISDSDDYVIQFPCNLRMDYFEMRYNLATYNAPITVSLLAGISYHCHSSHLYFSPRWCWLTL